jgi:transcriptional regulator with XRE-family HTH domain
MTTQEYILALREKNKLTQEEFAEKLFITRQAVSRWETGETVPNTEALKQISKIFGVSINAILGQPQNTICQVCGSPLDDDIFSREADGTVNDKYCKWCYADGVHQYESIDSVIEAVLPHMNWGTPEQMREYLQKQLVTLEHWHSCSQY